MKDFTSGILDTEVAKSEVSRVNKFGGEAAANQGRRMSRYVFASSSLNCFSNSSPIVL